MANRKRRSLIGNKASADGGTEASSDVDDESGAGSEGAPAPADASPPPEDSPVADPFAPPEPDPFAPPAATDNLAASGFVTEDTGDDPWGAPREGQSGGQSMPPTDMSGTEVREYENKSGGLYASTGKKEDDTTDNAWHGSAFGAQQASLPPGWDTPEAAKPPPEPMKHIQRDFFGSEDEPPTEEAPSAVYEERQPAYSAPMNVPEPPPIPGLFDRFTPPPVARKAGPSSSIPETRPKFEATPRPAPRVEEQAKPLGRPPARRADSDDDDGEKGGPPIVLIIAGVGAAALAGLFMLVLLMVIGGGRGGTPAAAPPTPPMPPPPQQVLDVRPPPATVTPPTPTDLQPPPTTPETPAVTTTTPPTTPPATTTTPPVTPPAVTTPTKVPTKPPVKNPAASQGTLKIRSNRRVLIKVNNQPRDYSPLDLKLAPGSYTISASLPGKPESEQTFTVDLSSGETEPVNFSF
jgi:hypothetical protein